MSLRQLIGIGCIATVSGFEIAAIAAAYGAVLCNLSLRVTKTCDQT
jgi:hypothetical protein